MIREWVINLITQGSNFVLTQMSNSKWSGNQKPTTTRNYLHWVRDNPCKLNYITPTQSLCDSKKSYDDEFQWFNYN